MRWIALLVLITGGIAGVRWWAGARREVTYARDSGGGRLRGPEERDTEALEATGTIEGTLVRVASKHPGKVARVRVREGDPVAAGQSLVTLEGDDANAQADQARAQLARATARLEEALAGTRPEALRQAEAEWQRAEAAQAGAADAVRNLGRQWERSTELKQRLEAAQSQVAATQAALEASAARLERVQAGARPEELREAEQAVTAAEATARRAAEEEERMRVAYEGGAVARRSWDVARTERDVATADLGRARARLADLRAGARPEEIREAEHRVAAARAESEGARASLAGARQLYEDRLPARRQLEAAEADLRAATAAAAAARAHRDLLRSGTRPEVVRELRAQVREARAALALAETRRRDLEIRSPIAGTVTDRKVEPGEVILPGASLLELADPSPVWVRVYLPERVYGGVHTGDTVSITTDSLPGEVFTGRVVAIAREAEFTPRNVQTKEERVSLMFAVKIEVENPRHRLLIGMPVDARFR
jgi:multidrug resistance efflux pump